MARSLVTFSFAMIPIDAIGDPDLAPPVLELYCLLRKLGFQRREFTIGKLCVMLAKRDADNPAGLPKPPSRRSIYRWLAAMEDAGWLTWERRGGDHDRFIPHDYKGVTPVSHDDTTQESGVSGGSHACDSGDTSHVSPESHADPDLPHQDAAAERPKNPERILEESPPPTPSTAPGGGGGGEDDSETRTILRASGVKSPQALARLAGVPAAVARRTAAACRRMSGGRDPAALLVSYLDAYLASGEEIAPESPARPRHPPDVPPLPAVPPLPPARRAALVAAARTGWRQEQLE